MSIEVKELSPDDRKKWHDAIAKMEKGVRYPIGDDFFEIDHGADYFSFFDRMGKSAMYAAFDGETIAAIGSIVMRSIPPHEGLEPRACWYICDLKVSHKYRRNRIPIKMFKAGFPRKYPICPKGYAVSMNPGDGSENPVVRLAGHVKLAPVSVGAHLLFYSLSAEQIRIHRPMIELHRGPISFLSMSGVKDIVLESTQAPMPMLHLQFGPCAQGGSPDPIDDQIHMFCTPSDDPLAEAMLSIGITPTATATVLHHRMGDWDWSFILTNEI